MTGLASIVLVVILFTYGQTIFMPILFGIFIGSIWITLANQLSKISWISYSVASGVLITLVLLVFIAIFVVPGVLIDPVGIWAYMENSWQAIYSSVSERLPDLLPESITSAFSTGAPSFISGVMNATTFVTQMLLSLFYSFAFLVSYPRLTKHFPGTFSFNGVTLPGWEDIRSKVINYLGGLTKMVIILAVMYAIVLYIMQVPQAGFIALGAALLSYIPTVGTFMGVVGAAIATYALTDSLAAGLIVLVTFEAIQIFDEYYITPQVVGSAVELNVFASVFFITFFGWLWGVAGIFLALWLGGLLVDTLKLNKIEQRYIKILT